MTRSRSLILLLVLLLALGVLPAGAVEPLDSPLVQQPVTMTSHNVTYLGTLPLESPGVSAKVRAGGGHDRVPFGESPYLPARSCHVTGELTPWDLLRSSEAGEESCDERIALPTGHLRGRYRRRTHPYQDLIVPRGRLRHLFQSNDVGWAVLLVGDRPHRILLIDGPGFEGVETSHSHMAVLRPPHGPGAGDSMWPPLRRIRWCRERPSVGVAPPTATMLVGAPPPLALGFSAGFSYAGARVGSAAGETVAPWVHQWVVTPFAENGSVAIDTLEVGDLLMEPTRLPIIPAALAHGRLVADNIVDGDFAPLQKSILYLSGKQHAKSISTATSRGSMSSLEADRSAHCRLPPYGIDRLYVSADGMPLHIIRNLTDGTQIKLDPTTNAVIGRFSRNAKSGTRQHYIKQKDERIVLVPGAAAPKLVSREMVKAMKQGSVVVDIAIDQGGCFETSKPTTHADPTYVVDDVVHYCVTNMPGAVPRTSTYALNNATLPFVLALADKGWKRALADDAHLREGLNVARGRITHAEVAAALGAAHQPAAEALK